MGALQKYGFRIQTRNGLILDRLSVHARDRAEAERRINQIYHYCTILECREHAAIAPARWAGRRGGSAFRGSRGPSALAQDEAQAG